MAEGSYRYPDEDELLPRLMAAVVVSLLAHAAFFGVVAVGTQLGWWEGRAFSLFRKERITPEEVAKMQAARRQREEERKPPPELVFVQVTQPSAEPPKESEFYSSRSSRAANPEPGETDRPKIDGTQTQLIRTEASPRAQAGQPSSPSEPAPAPARPSPAPAEPADTPEPPNPKPVEPAEPPKVAETKPPAALRPGDGERAVPEPGGKNIAVSPDAPEPKRATEAVRATTGSESPWKAAPTAPVRSRPKTVTEAKLRQSLLAGEKMRQDGGVRRKGPVALDVIGMEFGAYDEALAYAVENRWFTLLDERRFAGGATGRVVVRFKLFADGSVRIVEPQESTVDRLLTSLCVRAIRDPSPFEKWPSDMLRMVGTNSREMRFTFFYN